MKRPSEFEIDRTTKRQVTEISHPQINTQSYLSKSEYAALNSSPSVLTYENHGLMPFVRIQLSAFYDKIDIFNNLLLQVKNSLSKKYIYQRVDYLTRVFNHYVNNNPQTSIRDLINFFIEVKNEIKQKKFNALNKFLTLPLKSNMKYCMLSLLISSDAGIGYIIRNCMIESPFTLDYFSKISSDSAICELIKSDLEIVKKHLENERYITPFINRVFNKSLIKVNIKCADAEPTQNFQLASDTTPQPLLVLPTLNLDDKYENNLKTHTDYLKKFAWRYMKVQFNLAEKISLKREKEIEALFLSIFDTIRPLYDYKNIQDIAELFSRDNFKSLLTSIKDIDACAAYTYMTFEEIKYFVSFLLSTHPKATFSSPDMFDADYIKTLNLHDPSTRDEQLKNVSISLQATLKPYLTNYDKQFNQRQTVKREVTDGNQFFFYRSSVQAPEIPMLSNNSFFQ